jgi:hypothetical protein
MPRHNSTNLEDEISWAYIGTETETQVKLIENYKSFNLTPCM